MMEGFVAGHDAYRTLEEIKEELRDVRKALVTLAEVQVQQRADRSVFDQYRVDNEESKNALRQEIDAVRTEFRGHVSNHNGLARRVYILIGGVAVLAFVFPLWLQYGPGS